MTPDDVAHHPSVRAIREPCFDFSLVAEYAATCAACGRRGTARSGERARSPCDHPGACAFKLAAPPPSLAGQPLPWRVLELRGAVETEPDMTLVPRQPLVPPLPPHDGSGWRARHAAVAGLSPALAEAMPELPIGWAGLVELAAHALAARGLGDAIRLRQAKEKFGTARIYVSSTGSPEDQAFTAARAILDWAVAMSASVCARDGTPDGRLGRASSGCWITLGARAWAEEKRAREVGSAVWRAATDLHPAWARPDA